MTHFLPRTFLAVAVAVGLCSLVVPARSAEPPPETFLWQIPPFDRLELINGEVHDIEPRRIPPGTALTAQPDEYIGTPGLPPFRELVRHALYRIHRMDDDQDYYVHGSSIKRIVYYEDLLLEEARRLIGAGRYEEAEKSLAAVLERNPKWPGLFALRVEDRQREAEQRAQAGDFEHAFWALAEEKRLREEAARVGSEDKLPEDAIGQTVRQRIESLVSRWIDTNLRDRRHGEVRRTVARLATIYPDSPLIGRAKGELTRRAEEALAESNAAEKRSEFRAALAAVDRALEIDPALPQVRAATDHLATRYPILAVAVERLADYRFGIASWTRADVRTAELLHLPLMHFVADQGKFESAVLANLTQTELNKQAAMELRTGLVWPGDGKLVTIVDVERLLAQGCEPTSPLYHPAFARLVAGLSVEFPSRLIIQFDRPQYQAAAWLQIPFLRVGHDPSLSAMTDGRFGFSGIGPFRLADRSADQAVFVANPRFLTAGRPIIQQVTERRIESAAARLRALKEGEVDLVADVPPRHWERVAQIPGARLVPLAAPRLHVLQFNLERRELRHRTLRRAIDLAIDRPAILSKLGFPKGQLPQIITGPVPYGTLGYNQAIAPRPADLRVAKLLLFGARKELGGIGSLRLVHSGNEVTRAACEDIARMLRAIGLNINVMDAEEELGSDPRSADLRYESYTVSDPVYDTVTLLTRNNPSLARHGSPWLRQVVVDLVEAPNLSTASKVLPELHRILFEDTVLLPLWQWSERFAVADNIQGMPKQPGTVYQQVAEWSARRRLPAPSWAAEPPSQ